MNYSIYFILFLLIVFLIWVLVVWNKQKVVRDHWTTTTIEFDKTLKYTPFLLPYRVSMWDDVLTVSQCSLLCKIPNQALDKDASFLIRDNTAHLHTIATTLTKLPESHHECMIQRIIDGGTEFGYDTDQNDTRIATLIFYLNENYDGGELDFPDLDLFIKPKRGRLVLYWNTDLNMVLKESRHRTRYMVNGIQWKVTLYVHSKIIS
jgi:hypothetical protein